jgi:hypothetical protein
MDSINEEERQEVHFLGEYSLKEGRRKKLSF